MISGTTAATVAKQLEHGMEVVEGVVEKTLQRVLTVDEMKFGFMTERGTTDAVLILRWMQEEYHAK